MSLVLLAILVMWAVLTPTKPIGDFEHSLAVWTPFGVVGAMTMTFIAAFIPVQQRKTVTIVAAVPFALTTLLSVVA